MDQLCGNLATSWRSPDLVFLWPHSAQVLHHLLNFIGLWRKPKKLLQRCRLRTSSALKHMPMCAWFSRMLPSKGHLTHLKLAVFVGVISPHHIPYEGLVLFGHTLVSLWHFGRMCFALFDLIHVMSNRVSLAVIDVILVVAQSCRMLHVG